jgi:hypothetical protein
MERAMELCRSGSKVEDEKLEKSAKTTTVKDTITATPPS